MALIFFLKLAFHRLRSRAGLTLLLILSIALTVGVLASIPVFSNAVSLRLLQEELRQRTERLNRPAFTLRVYALSSFVKGMSLQEVEDRRDWLASLIGLNMAMPMQATYVQSESREYQLRGVEGDPRFRFDRNVVDAVHVVYVEGIEPHVRIIDGAPFGQALGQGALAVWLERHYAERLGLQVGDGYVMGQSSSRPGTLIPVQIAGLWEAVEPGAAFWYRDPQSLFNHALLTTREQYETNLYPYAPDHTAFNFWFFTLDESRLNLDYSQAYIAGLQFISQQIDKYLPGGKLDVSPLDELARGQQRKTALTFVLTGFAAPALAMLVYFVGAMSGMAARFQRREIALLSSRGSSRVQVLLLITLETVLLLAAALPVGILIGLGLASLMSYSATFLRFEPREIVPMQITAVDWRAVALGLAVSVVARLAPTWHASRVSVVAHERRMIRDVAAPTAARLCFVALMAGVTYYAYRQLALKGTLGVISWQIDDPSNDPLLLAAPSLFLFTAPLVLAELYAILMRPISQVSRILPFVSAYLGFMHLGREGGQYRAPSYLLILCLTLGVFYASVARSSDAWLVERQRYEVGADLTFKPALYQAGDAGTPGNASGYDISTTALPLSEYDRIPGVAATMWVEDIKGVLPLGNISQVRVLGIDRLVFPRIAYFRRDFSSSTLGELMNQMASRPNAILVTKRMLAQAGVGIGDPLPLELSSASSSSYRFTFEVVGVFDFFPTVYDDKLTAIVNADFLDLETGGEFTKLSNVWMRLKPGANGAEVLKTVERYQIAPVEPRDLGAMLQFEQQRLERVGIFGLLSICFFAGAALATIGMLVYSFSSLVARAQRFAVMRAMGMGKRAVVRTILIEYTVMLAYAIAAGFALGVAASVLYVPLFPLTDSRTIPIPPFTPLIDWPRAAWIVVLMAVTLVLVLAGVIVRVARERVFELLRMGGWE